MPVLGAHKGYTRTHQVIADVREFGGGLEVAHRLAKANIITNKNLLPDDSPEDWDRPSGLRIGTTEVTRLGMGEVEMQAIADMIAGVLVEGRDPEHVKQEALELRAGFQTVQYCFGTNKGLAPVSSARGRGRRSGDAQARRAAGAVAGREHRPPRQPRAPEPLGREGGRPSGLQREHGEPDDRAVLRRSSRRPTG